MVYREFDAASMSAIRKMTSDRQELDHSVPKHDIAALHHDRASRLLVALGHGHLGAHQSTRLSQTLQVATNQYIPQKRSLFDSSIDRFTRPLPVEKGLQKRQSNNIPTASSSLISTDKDNGQIYPSLSHALPEWFQAQNPHCLACSVPLLVGINANFDPVRRGLVCAACGSGSPMGMPDKESKRKLRSIRVRKTVRAKDKESSSSVHAQATKKARIELEVHHEDKIKSSQQQKAEQNPKVREDEVNQASPASLDARMKQKKRKKDKEVSQMASAVPFIDSKQPIPQSDNLDNKSKTEKHTPEVPTPQSKGAQIPKSASTQSRQPLSASKPAKQNDKQALRNMLAANKKKKDDVSKTSGSKTKSTASSGLQSFLDSL